MKFIKFTLNSPLQSWGEDSRWDYRATALFPSKSAIIGLLGCCLGIPRGAPEIIELDNSLCMAVRSERSGSIMTDYHTVQDINGSILNAEGKPRTGGNTLITPKQYLQDALFTIIIWGKDSVLKACYDAMWHPKWSVYLGRKSCVPSIPIIPTWIEAETPEKAVLICNDNYSRCDNAVQVEMDCNPNDTLSDTQYFHTRHDKVVHGDLNEYNVRWVKRYTVSRKGESTCT